MTTMFITGATEIAELIIKLEKLQVESGVVEDMKQLQRTLKRIEALVEDAEQMEIHDKSTKLWLAELSEVSGDAQGVVDELEYEIVRSQVDQQNDDGDDDDDDDDDDGYRFPVLVDELDVKARVPHYFYHHQSSGKHIKKDDKYLQSCSTTRYTSLSSFLAGIIADRVERINERLDEICKSRLNFQLTSEDGIRRPELRPKYPLPTSHMVNTSQVYGREDDKKKIVDLMISNSSNNLGVISIVGKGGIGKTTVAQLIYSDCEVSAFFDLKIWICVSLEFDTLNLTREIVEVVLGKSCNSSQLGRLHDVLCKKLAGKKILLVLDDVWILQRSLWESFKIPLDNEKQLVRIILTTRNEEISSIIKGTNLHYLDYLPDKESWELFKSQAFCGKNSEKFPNLEGLGMRIVRKSGGLPLVVKSLGGILRDSTDEEKWKDVLENELWEVEENNEILPILQLSYIYLPNHLRPCFLSCTVFPKDYELKKDEVVHLWLALGYIRTKSQSFEDIGNDYFDELRKRSFFDLDNRHDNKERRFKMHDSIHDLALHILHNSRSASSSICVPNLESMIKLRAQVCNFWLSFKSDNVKHLRFVALNTIPKLPDSLHSLYNLRVLVVNASISTLPHQIGNLINLIYLRIRLLTLPDSICQLKNLVTLDLSSSRHVGLYLPHGFRKLSKLERLYLHTFANTKLRELKSLVNLRGTLCICNIKNINDFEDAKEADLKNKPNVEDLRFYWNDLHRDCDLDYNHLHLKICNEYQHYMQRFSREKKGEDLLVSLQPHTNLRSLSIKDYDGTTFPSWLGDPSFSTLAKIHLIGFVTSSLPMLGQLPLLQYLKIEEFSHVTSIGHEFLRNLLFESSHRDDEKKAAFPSLLKLEFYNMDKWEEWHGVQEHDFSMLQELTIKSCPFITTIPALLIKLCSILTTESVNTVGDIKLLKHMIGVKGGLHISGLKNIVNEKDVAQVNMKTKHQMDRLVLDFGLHSKEEILHSGLHFEVCSHINENIFVEVDNIQFAVLESLQPHANLCELHVYEYCGVSFPHWIGHPSFSKLTKIVISECAHMNITHLPTLGQLPSLEHLVIHKIIHLKAIGYEFCRFSMTCNKVGFPCLTNLVLEDMLELVEWRSFLDGDFPQLQYLRISNCPKLASIRTSHSSSFYLHYTSLDRITLSGFTNITVLPTLGQLPRLKFLKIEKILHVKTIGYELCRFGSGWKDNASNVAFPSLKELDFSDMRELQKWNGVLGGDFPQLEILTVENCPMLKTLPTVPLSVSELHLSECSCLKSLQLAPDNVRPPKLLKVSIQNCVNLKELARMRNIDHSRVEFNVNGCPKLRFPINQKC